MFVDTLSEATALAGTHSAPACRSQHRCVWCCAGEGVRWCGCGVGVCVGVSVGVQRLRACACEHACACTCVCVCARACWCVCVSMWRFGCVCVCARVCAFVGVHKYIVCWCDLPAMTLRCYAYLILVFERLLARFALSTVVALSPVERLHWPPTASDSKASNCKEVVLAMNQAWTHTGTQVRTHTHTHLHLHTSTQ